MMAVGMYMKIHKTQGGKIVAVCDDDLLGRILKEGDLYMDLERYRGFYAGERVGEEDVKKALEGFSSANLVGKEAVKAALSAGVAGKGDVMYINKIPYIQIYRF